MENTVVHTTYLTRSKLEREGLIAIIRCIKPGENVDEELER